MAENDHQKDTEAIPITSYTSYNDEESDSEADSESEKSKMNENKKPPTAIDDKKAKKLFESDSETDEKAEKTKTYMNVLNKLSTKTSSSATSVSASPKKTPIIKAGQTAKEREETKMSFIGPKLPLLKSSSQVDTAATVAAPPTLVTSVSSDAESSEDKIQKEINYSKDELAKYDNLLRMSQLYAKYNQVINTIKFYSVFKIYLLVGNRKTEKLQQFLKILLLLT